MENYAKDVASFPRPIDGNSDDRMILAPSERSLFLDGSGKLRQHSVMAYCGFIAHPYAMQDFEDSWRTLLVAAQLTQGLHMTEAMTWSGEVWPQRRQQWGPLADDNRAKLLRTFALTVRSSPLRAVGSVASTKVLTEKSMEAKRPDLVMFEHAIGSALRSMSPDGALMVFCDWEDGFDALCCKLLAKLRIQRPELGRRVKMLSFADDKSYAQLQAADMFAYLAAKELLRQSESPDSQVDPLYRLLIETTETLSQSTAEMYDAETFRRMVEAHQ